MNQNNVSAVLKSQTNKVYENMNTFFQKYAFCCYDVSQFCIFYAKFTEFTGWFTE